MHPLIVLGAVGALIVSAATSHALTRAERQNADLCAAATRATESTEALPRGLLTAISLKESGRWDSTKKQSVAWPWTVTAEGKGSHYPSKQDALRTVAKLRARGVSNIDVGCMQINLRYHPHAFENLEAALDPVRNVAYAGEHLRQLREDHKTWPKAVERYHTSDPKRGLVYRRAVYKLKYDVLGESPKVRTARGRANWKARNEKIRRDHAAARKVRLKNSRKLRQSKASQSIRLRAAFEERKAKVLRDWEEMLRKRREKLRGKGS